MQQHIRDATEDDFPAMLEMAHRFIDAAWSRVNIPFCHESCEALLRNLMESETGILLVNHDCSAMLGALVYPWHFNRSILTGQELFWYGEGAMELLDEAERRAREMGAETFNMAAIEHMRGPVLERLYTRRGYQPSERIYIRELG